MMRVLYHTPFCARSRFVRLVLGEYGHDHDAREIRLFDRPQVLEGLFPEAVLPLLVEEDGQVVSGINAILGSLEDANPREHLDFALMPQERAARAETRRLMEWAMNTLEREVTGVLVREKIDKRFLPLEKGGGAPDMRAIRAARAHLVRQCDVLQHLATTRRWLAGDTLTFADLAIAAHLSCADYLGDMPWDDWEIVRDWYGKIKSRPAFRPLLQDRVPGMAPSESYANLDF
jgi:glutathione S-transferase